MTRADGGRYRPDLDGLRAVAVLCVVLYHAFPTVLSGGFVGVDVFFVLSGFLISTNIFRDLRDGTFRIAEFYRRRIRRIFPALLLVMAACTAFGACILLPAEFAALGKQVLGGAAFAANIVLLQEAGYFDTAARSKPLLHLWSLGIEEQFYLVWPWVMLLAHRMKRQVMPAIAMLALASLLLSIGTAYADADLDFYSPFTRFWELACGGMLGWVVLPPPTGCGDRVGWPPPWRRRINSLASVAGLGVLLATATLFDAQMRFPGWLAVLPVLGAVTLIATGPCGLVNRLILSNDAAVFLGLISYPLYLWHWPLFSYADILRLGRPPTPLLAAALLAASAALAWLTYRIAERPIRATRSTATAARRLAVMMAAMASVGAAIWLARGLPWRYPDLPSVDVGRINAAIHDGIFRPTRDMQVGRADGLDIARIGSGDRAVLLTGDSVLFQYGPRVQALFEQHLLAKTVYFVVGASCPPVPGIVQSGRFAHCHVMAQRARDLAAQAHVETVVLGALWQGYVGEAMAVEDGTARLPLTTPHAVDLFYDHLEHEVSGFVAAGRRVYLILSVPFDRRFDPARMVRRSWLGVRVDRTALDGVPVTELRTRTADADRRLREIARRTGATAIDPLPDICGPGPICRSLSAGAPNFADDKHLRPAFVRDNIRFLDPILTR